MSEQERPETISIAQAEYPLVALVSIVAFPHNRQALPAAREKTVRAIEEAVLRSDRLLVAASQCDVDIEDPQPKDIFPIATLVEVKTLHRQPDGSIQVLFNGLQRVTIEEYLDTEPFMRVRIIPQEEPQVQGPQTDAMVRHTTTLFERYAQLNRRFSSEDISSVLALKTPGRLADTLAAHVVTQHQQQQDLLATLNPMDRLEKICVIMGNEIEILELEKTIRGRVRSQVDRSQKEFYLREQLRAIQEELGMEALSEANELRAKLKEKQPPPEAETKLRKEIERLERTSPQSAELTVIRSYIDWVLALPWHERTEEHFDLEATLALLNEDHFGLDLIKERIIEFLAARQLRQQVALRSGTYRGESQGQILCLIGPPGVGKTSLGLSIARALGRKFARIALGGVHDEAEIRGHRRTYVGALPGRIIQSMKTVGVRNPVFLLDEIDKLSSEYRGDPAAALLEVLDPEQNKAFTDHYLELPFNLSEVFFICTGNVKYQIPRPLADRMDIIELSGYMLDEKVSIGQRHLLPKVLQEHGLTAEQLKIPQAVMKHIVTDYTREAGVRTLERQLAMICRKVARRVLERPSTHLRLTSNSLPQYLGIPHYNNTPPTLRTPIGVAMGLGVTEMGGVLLPVEVVTMVGKGDLLITGQLGDVMRESVMAALSYIRTRAKELQIDPNFQENLDLHIHLPENAMPKDGPSAGITIATALISVLTRRPIRSKLAMTGEVTLLGNVLPIGGLREKVLAAQQASIDQLVIPAANKKDLAEIPAKIRQKLHFFLADCMDQVIEAALMPSPSITSTDPTKGQDSQATEAPHSDKNSPVAYRDHMASHSTNTTSPTDSNKEEERDPNNPPFLIPHDPKQHGIYPCAQEKGAIPKRN